MTQYIAARPNMEVVAAVDTDPELQGRDIGELCSLGDLGIQVSPSVKSALRDNQADVALLTTVSDLSRILPQIEEVIEQGFPVVTTCEELTYPWISAPELAARLDERAKKRGVPVLATGVNPGFMMDTLPICLTAVCQRVDAVKVSRIQDASTRRVPFQRKIGAGLTLDEFEKKKTRGNLRHVGLAESMHMIASRLGWKLDRTEDMIAPVITKRTIISKTMTIKPGAVAGVQQIGRAFIGKKEKITLVFRASVGESHPEDTVEVFGEPHLISTVQGGIHGDVATCAIALNAIPVLLNAEPGLKTMIDLPPLAFSLL
jgi:4-hydroxy-tetrahydrodipicolinate reductase